MSEEEKMCPRCGKLAKLENKMDLCDNCNYYYSILDKAQKLDDIIKKLEEDEDKEFPDDNINVEKMKSFDFTCKDFYMDGRDTYIKKLLDYLKGNK